jgi:hypothetical protein
MIRAVALGVLCASAAAQAQADTFVRTQVPDQPLCLSWGTREYRFSYHAAGSEQTPGTAEFLAMDAAFDAWRQLSESCSDFRFEKGPMVAQAEIGFDPARSDNVNVLVFREAACRDVVPQADPCLQRGDCASRYQCWDHNDMTIALTTTTFSYRTGLIYDADVEFNAAPQSGGGRFLFTTISSPPCEQDAQSALCVATDIQNTLTHEIGHIIGLDHVGAHDSTMAPTAPLGETRKRVLDLGTRQGFCTIYPRGRPSPGCDLLMQGELHITADNRGTPGLAHLGCVGGGMGAPAALGLLAWSLLRRRTDPTRASPPGPPPPPAPPAGSPWPRP